MARGMRNKFLVVAVCCSQADRLRTIADRSLAAEDRDLLITLAQDLERQAKTAETRARQEVAREA